MIGILFTIGLINFLLNFNNCLVPVLPRVFVVKFLTRFVPADLVNLPPKFLIASLPNLLRAASTPYFLAYLLIAAFPRVFEVDVD